MSSQSPFISAQYMFKYEKGRQGRYKNALSYIEKY